jgi:hypothetical protein
MGCENCSDAIRRALVHRGLQNGFPYQPSRIKYDLTLENCPQGGNFAMRHWPKTECRRALRASG